MSDRAVVEDVLSLDEGVAALAGTRCGSCNAVYFPSVQSCRNPVCATKAVEATWIDGRGALYSFTVQRYRPPALFGIDPWQPYALGWVDMEGDVRILGMIEGVDVEDIRIGMPLTLSTRPLRIVGENRFVTHVFVPAAGDLR